jgi:hypothetical protein
MSIVADTLRTAAALIGTHGWVQADFGSPEEGFCALGGIYAASDIIECGPGTYATVYDTETYIVRELVDRGAIQPFDAELPWEERVRDTLVGWNDDPNRTADEVIDLFLTAADAIS